MATIANLQIDLSARTARFSEGLQRAQQRVQQFSQRVQVDLQRVTQVGQRAALVFSGMTAALTLVTKRAADYASTMDKVASQTGIAVEQIQELAFAANQSNADLASLESGLRAFVRRTAEAAAGNTSFLKGFERLGFTQEQVRAGLQDIDGFLMQVADRVAELGTTAEQSAVLMTIMGDAGRRLVPFMAQGARGIRELREQAQELGLVMDEQAVRRLAAFNDRMAVLQERTAASSREMAVWFLPAMEAGVGLFEDIIGAIQDIDPALRAHAVRWTVVVGAVLGAVGVLGVLGTAVSQAGALLGAFGRLLSLVFSPIVIYSALAIGAIALFRAAWENDWLGIRTAATDAWDNYIKPVWERLKEPLKSAWEWVVDTVGTAWEWIVDTTWAEKLEDIKGWLTAGWGWVVDIAGTAWDWLTETTWVEKLDDIRGWLDSAWDWTINLLGDAWAWIEEHLPWLAATVETLAGWLGDAWSWTWNRLGDAWDWLDQHAPAVTGTIRNLRDWLSSAWNWTINILGSGWEWLRDTDWAATIEQVKQALTGAWDWTINRVGDAWEWLANWEFGEVREIGTAILNLVLQPLGGLYDAIKQGLETGDWSGVWGATADVWRRGIQIAVGLMLATRTVQMVLNAIRTGLGLAATGSAAAGIARLGMPGVLGALSILVSLAEAREQGDYRKFGVDLIAALAAGIGIGMFTGSPYAGALAFTIVLNFEIGSWIGDKLDQLQQHPVMKELRAAVGGGPTYEGEVLLRWARGERFSLADRETFIGPGREYSLAERLRLWFQDTALGRLLFRGGTAPQVEIPATLRIEQVTGFPGMASILEAIYRAEGGAAARVPYGMTGFEELGRRFERELNQRRFEEILSATGIKEGSEDFFAAAAAVSVLHYWDTFRQQFPEVGARTFAELEPALQRLFIEHLGRGFAPPGAHPLNANWTRNVGRILGLPGFQSGTPWTGWGPTDEVAGVVHRREAVIPWDVLRRGPAAVLEFLGAPGFQEGYIPAAIGGLTGVALAEPDPGFLARLVESVVGGLESRGIIDPETARGLRELTDNLMSIIGGLYDQAKALWEQLGQVDLGEYVAEARRFRDELEALGDVAEQERLAILDRIERLDELVEIERLVAEATGQAFDETAFRAAELSRAITQVARQMFEAGESVEAIAEALAPWVAELEPLQRQIRLQDTVNSALERFATQLSDGNRLLGEFLLNLRFEGGGLRFATDSLWSWAAGLMVDFITALFDGGYQRQPEPRTFEAPDPYQYGLAMARGQRAELEAEIQRLEQRLEQAEAAYDALFSNAIDAWWHSNFRQDLVRERQANVELARQELENARRAYEAFDLTSFLGLDPGNIAQAIESGFDMADLSRLGESLENVIRTALVRAWVTSEEMVRLQESFRDLLNEVVDEFIETGELRAGALDRLRTVIAAMEERGEAFAEVLERLGFTSERLNDSFSRMVRNIPQGYRVERALFEAAPPRIPALAAGGIVTRPTLALVGEAGPEAVVPLDRGGIGGVYVHIERMEVQDGRDFGRRLDEELRRRGLVAAGNVTAWRGRR